MPPYLMGLADPWDSLPLSDTPLIPSCFPLPISLLSLLPSNTSELQGGNCSLSPFCYTACEIPEEIGNLLILEILYLADTGLTGRIPASIFNISSLTAIDLHNNSLSGNLPPMAGLQKLGKLVLWGNNLSGNILNSISNASMLMILDVSDNSFSGLIPNTLGNLRHLEWFQIRGNHFITEPATHEWSFLSSLANCKNLRFLYVSLNPLNGILPTYIGNLSTTLQELLASDCELQGNIPLEVANLSNMFLLDLSNNKISGSIPATIGGLRNVQSLTLQTNELQGPIPEKICGLERLYTLSLSFNKLSGPMPACLGNLTSLRNLYLGSNKLSYAIPSTLWSLKDILKIDLSSNYFSGSHPLDIGHLRALMCLNLSKNLLMSDMVSTIGGPETLVSLDLSNNKFHGHIPESFGGLISLEFLDLCNNNLSGVIPKSLEKLSNLKYFNVSYNRLEGEIPTGRCFQNFSYGSFMKNYALCGPSRLLVPPCKSSIHRNSKLTILRVLRYGLPSIATIVVTIIFTIIYRKRQSRSITLPVKEDLLSLKTWRRISYAELSQATDGFGECNFLGSGSFGSVYKGRLSDGMNVAIKVFNLQIEGAFRSFDTECEAMRNIVHRNLVKVITCCSNVDFKALVLDFMPNGSLEKWLHSEHYFLDILQRINIMIDVASALEYLHAGQPTPIIHCDLKPSNILLDEDMVAHLGDFGIAKLLEEDDFMRQTMTLATIGYMAPDATLLRREDEYFIIKANCISSIMELALKCSAELPEDRNNMADVVAMLKKIKHKFLISIEQV
ncbi:receptor kinase-like protein Xa21 [Durio zibethinus]|uniref:Receptor kinase-like protein Xa21 n=1 Tax=Durio zibethinus TaxID=66656 RepID=A0A6P5Y500_DURZI|nr:receptor kinase-like protein Xa21 [Durio zibethinus]